ncbi:hypothetical protein EV190_105109 [Actinorugispora endophytica]|uniref:Tetratricopeptide repeat protein n=1 Tax=Actinorugispora endophytica TaxID=1605990 RepID=A0A4R6UZH6_9ACTN|nr:hypothetical protein EV190_105109 [Actinorugispora endophytica]
MPVVRRQGSYLTCSPAMTLARVMWCSYLMYVDLAFALTARGDTTEARRHAQRAADLARTTGSVRQRVRIAKLPGG